MNHFDNNIKLADVGLPSVMAVVLNYNGYEDTVKCIQSLRSATYPNLSIVLVDNASSDQSGKRLETEYADVPMIRMKNNLGYAAGNNAGIRYALERGAQYVLVLNNDVIVDSAFLEPMIHVATKYSDVGIVTCKLFYQSAPKVIYSAAGYFSKLTCTGVNRGKWLNRIRSQNKIVFVDFICGALFLARRTVFSDVGLFNEKYFMYYEDLEYSRRVVKKFRMVYTPDAVAFHKSGAGKGWRTYSELYLYYHTRNRLWAFRDEAFLYRIYLIVFVFANVVAKSFIVSSNIWNHRKQAFVQLHALYKGFKDGLLQMRNENK
jgi:GT2 family glycosyltransferase